jgi:hypothetical protein
MKFPEYEAKGIQPLVSHSPLDLWPSDSTGVFKGRSIIIFI